MKRKAYIEQLPTCFINDLMLEKLADQITPHNQNKLISLLSELTTDIETINYRLDIIDDLIAIPELLGTLRKVVDIILTNDRRSIYQLTTPDCFTALDSAVAAFEAYIRCMEIMHEHYLKKGSMARSDGIKRLYGFFEGRYNSRHFTKLRSLVQELRNAMNGRIRSVTIAVNFDEGLLPVSVGLVGFSDKEYEPAPTLLDRIVNFGRTNENVVMKRLRERYTDDGSGQGTEERFADRELFRELDVVTKKYVNSIEKILAEYQAVGFEDMCALEYQLDFYMGEISMIENTAAKGLKMCRPKLLPPDKRRLSVRNIFDPIYFGEANAYNLHHADKKSVVTNDITFDENAGFYVLTRANNGGKTTFLRAVGICQVLAQAGFYVPAEECDLSLCDCIYTHFPKEEKAGIDASRFTEEIKEFKAISDVITDKSLLLMNESIQSTTPKECVEIASKLVRVFCIIGVRGIYATHLTDIAYRVDELNRDEKLSTLLSSIVVCTDKKTGERLYKIEKGCPQETSFADSIFEKFGLDIEAIEKRAGK